MADLTTIQANIAKLKGYTGKLFALRSVYGFTIEHALDLVVTGKLRPHLGYTQGDVTVQAALLDYFAGRIGFAVVSGYFGGWYQYLGCLDVTKIHDLGA